jgi:hypothetical protein
MYHQPSFNSKANCSRKTRHLKFQENKHALFLVPWLIE